MATKTPEIMKARNHSHACSSVTLRSQPFEIYFHDFTLAQQRVIEYATGLCAYAIPRSVLELNYFHQTDPSDKFLEATCQTEYRRLDIAVWPDWFEGSRRYAVRSLMHEFVHQHISPTRRMLQQFIESYWQEKGPIGDLLQKQATDIEEGICEELSTLLFVSIEEQHGKRLDGPNSAPCP